MKLSWRGTWHLFSVYPSWCVVLSMMVFLTLAHIVYSLLQVGVCFAWKSRLGQLEFRNASLVCCSGTFLQEGHSSSTFPQYRFVQSNVRHDRRGTGTQQRHLGSSSAKYFGPFSMLIKTCFLNSQGGPSSHASITSGRPYTGTFHSYF